MAHNPQQHYFLGLRDASFLGMTSPEENIILREFVIPNLAQLGEESCISLSQILRDPIRVMRSNSCNTAL
ncbi:MAG TPA: hypothetical protein VHZ50_16695, partial [Puia sp.]|nr:hypothetical protein [Puia sp.]